MVEDPFSQIFAIRGVLGDNAPKRRLHEHLELMHVTATLQMYKVPSIQIPRVLKFYGCLLEKEKKYILATQIRSIMHKQF